MNTTRILDAFYPGASAARAQAGRAGRLWSIIRGARNGYKSLKRNKWIPYLVAASLVVTAWIAFHMYYYNLLVGLELDVKASWAQVEVQLQRRYHIQQNLTQIVMDYSKYEKDTLTKLIEMRTSTMAAGRADKATEAIRQPPSETNENSPPTRSMQSAGSELAKLFPDILLMAEQYPELKLTENLQQFSAAIIDTENQIAERVTAYNEAVNVYTTTLTQFPGNVFSAVLCFSDYEFYEPDRKLLDFKPVKY